MDAAWRRFLPGYLLTVIIVHCHTQSDPANDKIFQKEKTLFFPSSKGCLEASVIFLNTSGVSLQAVMAVNTKKRLSGLCKTYRAEYKDNVGVFVELEYINCMNNILICSCS